MMTESTIRLAHGLCADDARVGDLEWLLTNGVGGYALGTVAGVLARRYHGLLIAPVDPPLGRRLLFAKADAVVHLGDAQWPLYSNRWRDGVVSPNGHRTILGFRLDRQVPVWHYMIGGIQIEQRIWMDHGRNQSRVAFRWVGGQTDIQPRIRIGLLASLRDHHTVNQGHPLALEQRLTNDGIDLRLGGAVDIEVRGTGGRFELDDTWIESFFLTTERERGLEDTDRHLRIGYAEFGMTPGEWVGLSIACGATDATDIETSMQAEAERMQRVALAALPQVDRDRAPGWIGQLVVAADNYIFRRPGSDGRSSHSVIAGYPWFGDWGRDTMIALPGLTLATGRPDVALDVLRTFAGYVSEGMLPNVFPGRGEAPEYNTVDAALWFIEAWRAYLAASGDLAGLRRHLPVLVDIVRAYRDGTRYGIGMDPADGLIRAGEAGQQLTWMDARVDGREVTPRHGKAVEINALWFNALKTMAGFCGRLGEPAAAYDELAARVADGFARYHRGGQAGLYDVLDGPEGDDAAIRPNQLFAVSLPHSPLRSEWIRQCVVDECRAHLLTPYGLRSLSPRDSHYVGHYTGGVRERDGGYHQGPVWGWLLGHFALAEYRIDGDIDAAQARLAGMAAHLPEAGLGHISEIFDGDSPHRPRGAPAQAWSVACTLDAWWQLECARSRGPYSS